MPLRPATADDLPALEALARSEAVVPSLMPGSAETLAPTLAAEDEQLLAVTAEDGALIGCVRVVVRSRRSRIAKLQTLMLDPAARGTGLGARVLREVVARLVGEGWHRIEAEVYGFNQAGVRTFLAAGFMHEGTRRRAYDRHGEWQDGVIFGLLAEEAPEP